MKFNFLILSLLVIGCASVGEKSTSLPAAHEFSELDGLRLQELARIRSVVGDDVWPGYGHAELGMILVGDKNQWSLNIEQLPEYYHPIAVPESLKDSVKLMGETKAFRNWRGELLPSAPTDLYRAFSKEQTGNHFKQVRKQRSFLRDSRHEKKQLLVLFGICLFFDYGSFGSQLENT